MTEVTPSISQSLLLQVMEQLSAVDGKIGVLQGQSNLIIGDQKSAAESRRAIYEKLSKVDAIEMTVSRIVPLVDKHEVTYNQGTGVMSLGKWLFGIFAGGIGAALAMAVQYIFSGGRGPHP